MAQLAALFAAISDPMVKCLMAITMFCALRSSEVFGLIWSAYQGDILCISSTAWRSRFYPDNAKNDASRAPVPIPDAVRPYIDQWHALSVDTSPDALVFSYVPTKGRNKGKATPFDSYQFMQKEIVPIAEKLGIPVEMVNMRCFRRTAGTDMQKFGTIKDAQGMLRHDSPETTGRIYMEVIPESVRKAVNDRTSAVLACTPSTTTASQEEHAQSLMPESTAPKAAPSAA
jgi:integrase